MVCAVVGRTRAISALPEAATGFAAGLTSLGGGKSGGPNDGCGTPINVGDARDSADTLVRNLAKSAGVPFDSGHAFWYDSQAEAGVEGPSPDASRRSGPSRKPRRLLSSGVASASPLFCCSIRKERRP
jgi:hypothetical protein